MTVMATGVARAILALSVAAIALAPAACTHEYRPYHSQETARLWELGGRKVAVEIAKDQASRELGLMRRKSMPDDHGMLFVYAEPRVLRFWMKDTSIPLSIAFFEETGEGQARVVNIDDMQPFVEEPGGISHKPVRLALEMNQGWFAKNGVKAGDTVKLPDFVKEIVASEDR